ncbi:MAG: MotA/TolQ/ExbB proton channel family protein [Elusimicrobiota bacterium]
MVLNLSLWLGILASAGMLAWSVLRPGLGHNVVDTHGLVIVFGGLASSMLVCTPAAQIASALKTLLWILRPSSTPSRKEAAEELTRLAQKARAEGGILALRGVDAQFADGFLQRAVATTAACGETNAAHEILGVEIRRRRVARQEDSNTFRTMGTLAPMFGLLGTLVGMLQVLNSMSDPTRLGPAMALALSSAFLGIAIANWICIPLAGQIRSQAMRETILYEMIADCVIDIAAKLPTFLIELRLSSYLDEADAITASAGTLRENA